MRKLFLILSAAATGALLTATGLLAAGPRLNEIPSTNKHNLSSLNTGVTKRASTAQAQPDYGRQTQICIFCHTPHNSAAQTALWNRVATQKATPFGHYSSTTLRIDDPSIKGTSLYGEPNGVSRLCLSCHDGVTALGAVLTGSQIDFPATKDKANALDMATHHPVSFVYNQAVLNYIKQDATKNTQGYQIPATNNAANVRLDRQGRMQCTSCHDPHQNQSDDNVVTPFWVTGPVGGDNAHDSVCKTCHNITLGF